MPNYKLIQYTYIGGERFICSDFESVDVILSHIVIHGVNLLMRRDAPHPPP